MLKQLASIIGLEAQFLKCSLRFSCWPHVITVLGTGSHWQNKPEMSNISALNMQVRWMRCSSTQGTTDSHYSDNDGHIVLTVTGYSVICLHITAKDARIHSFCSCRKSWICGRRSQPLSLYFIAFPSTLKIFPCHTCTCMCVHMQIYVTILLHSYRWSLMYKCQDFSTNIVDTLLLKERKIWD